MPSVDPAAVIESIETALATTPAGLVEYQVDGQRFKIDRGQALRELEYWRRRQTTAAGTRSMFRTIDLSGGL